MDTSITAIDIVTALAVLGIVVVMVALIIPLHQQAEAAQPPGRGCEFTAGGNASKGRCIH
jgi:hypothetical protein